MDPVFIEFFSEKEIIKAKRNLLEFIPPNSNVRIPSRLKMDLRSFQRSVIAVNNFEGPSLSKSEIINYSLEEVLGNCLTNLEVLLKISNKDYTCGELLKRLQLVEDKISWINNHYPQITYKFKDLFSGQNIPQSVSARLKAAEDQVLWIEENFPQVANTCFDYTRDKTIENKGRVSKLRHYVQPVRAPPQVDHEGETGLEIIKRLEELQKKLKKK
jgi:hypothetical protein